MPREVDLTGQMKLNPIVTTARRWPCLREPSGSEAYFSMFPECLEDTRRSDWGAVTQGPRPGERGGGLFPVLTALDDGRLLCATRTAATHGLDAGSEISVSFSKDWGKTWSEYTVVLRGDPQEGRDMRNPAVGQAADGRILLLYGVTSGVGTDAAGQDPRMEAIASQDGGRTWLPAPGIDSPSGTVLHPHGQMRRLADGTLAFNARGSYSRDRYRQEPDLPRRIGFIYRSHDNGLSWDEPDFLGDGTSETSFLKLSRKHWVAYVRHNHRPNRIAHSHDAGHTWTEWTETCPGGSPAGGQADDILGAGDWRLANGRVQKPSPGSIVALPNGNVLVVYGYRAYPFGVRAIVSRDGGDTFDTGTEYVLSDTAYSFDCGYPSAICGEDGRAVVACYSIMDIERPDWGTCAMAMRCDQSVLDL